MARAISELSPKAQAVYRNNPDLAAKRSQQASGAQSDSSGGDSAGPAFSLPDFSGAGDKVLLVVAALLIGLAFYGRFVKPINLGLNLQQGLSGQPQTPVQSYIDQQNRKVATIADTMPGRILRTNPAKLGAS